LACSIADTSTSDLHLGDAMLGIMCNKGIKCECAKAGSSFNSSLNVIGASNGLGGLETLRTSRSREFEEFLRLVQADITDNELAKGSRRGLIQISQCPGIGKTTLLGLLSRDFPTTLAEPPCMENKEAGAVKMIGSLVTFNGNCMAVDIDDVPMEAAISTRVLYGALACHSFYAGQRCPNLREFDDVATSVRMVQQSHRIRVRKTLQILWRWFGRKPIFIGIDEALKCSDGIEEEEKLQLLLTAAGKLLDIFSNDPPVFVVLSSLSPDKFLRETLASNRIIFNILVYPVDRISGVRMLKATIKPGLKVSEDVLAQVEAVTIGHPRAIELAARFLSNFVANPVQLLSSDAARGLFIPLVDFLSSGTAAALASRPEPAVFDHLLSTPPVEWIRGSRILMGAQTVSVDDFVFSGQVLVTYRDRPTLTIAGWWLLAELRDEGPTPLDDSRACPSASLLRAAHKATKHPQSDFPGTLYEAFSIFFIAEALRRGGETLRAVVPPLYRADPGFSLPRQDISIQAMALAPSGLDALARARLVMDRVKALQGECLLSGSKGVVLVMPQNFAALDAVVVARDKVIGVQIKTVIEHSGLINKVKNVRSCLEQWKVDGCDILGADGLLLYVIGANCPPSGFTAAENESLITAQALRSHFIDVFFRSGLTFMEGNPPL
jgi:hypothetical protein